MTAPTTPPLAAIATAVAFVAYFVALHALVVGAGHPFALLLLVVAPWVVAGGSLLASDRRIALAGPVRALVGVVVAALLALVAWTLAAPLARHVEALIYLENLVFIGMLCALFAASLRPGRDALVTRLARVARGGEMPPDVVRYTRRVTLVWALYFALVALVSTVLFATQSRALWSAFVNLAIWPLTIAVFVLEYAVRRVVLPGESHVPLMAGAQAFRQRGRSP